MGLTPEDVLRCRIRYGVVENGSGKPGSRPSSTVLSYALGYVLLTS